MRLAVLKVSAVFGLETEYPVLVHHTEGGFALAELRNDVTHECRQHWIARGGKQGDVLAVPLTAIRFTD